MSTQQQATPSPLRERAGVRMISEIIIHCTATKEGRDYDAKDIDRWHRARGWTGIGYHYVIKLNGIIERGRPESQIGAHCLGHNENSIGVCYVGGLDQNGKAKDTRTPEQRMALRLLIKELLKKYPGATLHGHREFAKKSCPCFDVRALSAEVKSSRALREVKSEK